jgi:hypothetical protein
VNRSCVDPTASLCSCRGCHNLHIFRSR